MKITTPADERFIRNKFVDGGLVRIKMGNVWRGCWLQAHDNFIVAHFVDTDKAIEEKETALLPNTALEVASVTIKPQYVWYQGVPHIATQTSIQTTQRSLAARDIILRRPTLSWLRDHNCLPDPLVVAEKTSPTGSQAVGIWKQFFSPSFTDLTVAIERSKKRTGPENIVNKNFMVSRSLSDDAAHWLWHLFTPVGKIQGSVISVLPEFHVEVEDFLRNTQQTGWRLHELE